MKKDRALKQRQEREEVVRGRMKPVRSLPDKRLQEWLLKEVVPIHSSNSHRKDKGVSFTYMQRCGEEILVRVCKARIDRIGGETVISSIRESSRIFFSLHGETVYYQNYYNSYKSDRVTSWIMGRRPIYRSQCLEWEASEEGHLYTRNLKQVLAGTVWEHSQLGELYLGDHLPINAFTYCYKYIKYPALGYLVKEHLFQLARDALGGKKDYYCEINPVNLLGKSIEEVLGVDRKYLTTLRKINPRRALFGLMKELLKQEILVTEELLSWCRENHIFHADDLQLCLKHTSADKVISYIQTQAGRKAFSKQTYFAANRVKNVFYTYCGYLELCKKWNYDLSDEEVLFPQKLEDACDSVYAKEIDESQENTDKKKE